MVNKKKVIKKNYKKPNIKKPNKKVVNKPKRKIKFINVLIVLLLLYIVGALIYSLLNIKITNIYIKNNSYLKDQTIIELAGIDNYPSTVTHMSKTIEKNLEKSIYIKDAKVYKKWFSHVYIEVIENSPIFYNKSLSQTVLLDGTMVSEILNAPVLINYVPDTVYIDFIKEMQQVSIDIIDRISEIKYNPNEVDEERFLLTMTDGNYVYLTLEKYDIINDYVDIIKEFENKKGILYLDAGEYFEILEE